MSEYIKQAEDFCKKYNTTIDVNYSGTRKYFPEDKEVRDVYNVTITRIRNNKPVIYTFTFGDSAFNTEKNQEKVRNYTVHKTCKNAFVKTGKRKEIVKPSAYDILATLQKYEYADFDEFISEFGYTFDSEREYIKIKQLHLNVKDEYTNVLKLFSDCMDELQEIC